MGNQKGLGNFHNLEVRARVMVLIAVLIDGREASSYLSFDEYLSGDLCRAAESLAELSPEFRVPLIGTEFRRALREILGSSD